mgnify:CR=1 FL=1
MIIKTKPISIEEYNHKMDRIIKKSKNRPMPETLIKLLDEASKWDIKGFKGIRKSRKGIKLRGGDK